MYRKNSRSSASPIARVRQPSNPADRPDFKTTPSCGWPNGRCDAYDMDGAFNNLALSLTADANAAEVIDRLDEVLGRYGGRGAYARADQVSHRYLTEEFRQLESLATVFPTIFLGVAAFLLNVVFSRLFQTEREQIATLKAFGYSNWAIGFHYLQYVAVIASVGVVLGIIGGGWPGSGMSAMYMEFYRFPYLHYWIGPSVSRLPC
jgi:putative ABC transport system permease protein